MTHPHDGYAYDGCACPCCQSIRLIPFIRSEAATAERERLRAKLAARKAQGDGARGIWRWLDDELFADPEPAAAALGDST